VCDQLDNDCDGRTDEGTQNACGTCGVLPTEECDGDDNDCDGRVDEGILNVCGLCEAPPVEVCDGNDNDCDGRIDEGTLNACGVCGEVPVEVCDGLDNNCDGQIDEDLEQCCTLLDTQSCGLSQGECSLGQQICLSGVWDECDASLPEIEICDGLDNDCDSLTDEGLLNRCGVCGPLPIEECDGDDNDCDGRVDEEVLNACGGCRPVPSEVCDGDDNDCDGQIDENACQFETIYRYRNNTGFFYNITGVSLNGWAYQGPLMRVVQDFLPNTQALHHCIYLRSNTFYLSTQRCATQSVDRLFGYMYSTRVAGSVEFFRCYNDTNGYHITTSRPEAECVASNGWRNEGTLGYARLP
jgi:hypothetical protein